MPAPDSSLPPDGRPPGTPDAPPPDRSSAGKPDEQPPPDGLARRLGTADAVVVGMSAMVGAGVFAAFGPAARAAGWWLLGGLAVAAVIAYCNAAASAQLAAAYPTSGGTYVYGRERLGPWWGFVAGWGFVVGKSASCAAMALTVAAYALPGGPWWAQRLLAVVAVVALSLLNRRGITRTAGLARVLLAFTLAALAVILVATVTGTHAALAPSAAPARPGGAAGPPDVSVGAAGPSGVSVGAAGPPGVSVGAAGPSAVSGGATTPTGALGWYGVLQAAGLLFFAFAGYARVATLGEEVRDPARTIPRAIGIALGLTVLLYLLVGTAALAAAGPARLAATPAPLAEAVRAAGHPALVPVVTAGATVAALGALLALFTGVTRTALAMARQRDLPAWMAAVDPRHHVPHHAARALGVLVVVLVLAADLRQAIGFSSFGVLTYYAITNASAFTQQRPDRRTPRALNVVGLAGCVLLAVTLPVSAVLPGAAVLLLGLAARLVVNKTAGQHP